MNEPKDYEYLLLCDGSTISEENYPELVAVLGETQLPNLIDRFLQGAATAGTYKEAGLPNITGEASEFDVSGGVIKYTRGALYTDGKTYTANFARGGSDKGGLLGIDASRSSSIYGNSDTVQPPAYTTKIYICYAG